MSKLEVLLRLSVIQTELVQLAEVLPEPTKKVVTYSANILNLITITSSAGLAESSEDAEVDPKDPEDQPQLPPRFERPCRSSGSPRVVRLGTPKGS